ncbi:MAG: succinate dehydrogenase, hydrophobic membrane anchor protein [Proteobacteria bacterium]|nr:succinate dehydrogenase, hydrophobic membrane anchor protein [Pseudomonadota bacterium]
MATRFTLGRVRGLGSAKEGVHHWWMQRASAVALIPLYLWFAFSVTALAGAPHAALLAWVGAPVNAVLLIALIAANFYHGHLGLQVVFEDYVPHEGKRLACLLVSQFLSTLFALGGALAVLKIALGG